MPVWHVAPVEQQPELSLAAWQVYESKRGERHLVGWCRENGEGRVSSAIERFDAVRRRATTHSGRVYQLIGALGWNPDANYTWSRWCRLNNVTDARDVTEEVAAAIVAAEPSGSRG